MTISADSRLTTTARTHARTETEIDFPVGSPAPQPPIPNTTTNTRANNQWEKASTLKLALGPVFGAIFTIGTNIGLYGLKLFPFILTFRDDSNGSTPEGPRPYI